MNILFFLNNGLKKIREIHEYGENTIPQLIELINADI